jgi:hypothetical protein
VSLLSLAECLCRIGQHGMCCPYHLPIGAVDSVWSLLLYPIVCPHEHHCYAARAFARSAAAASRVSLTYSGVMLAVKAPLSVSAASDSTRLVLLLGFFLLGFFIVLPL